MAARTGTSSTPRVLRLSTTHRDIGVLLGSAVTVCNYGAVTTSSDACSRTISNLYNMTEVVELPLAGLHARRERGRLHACAYPLSLSGGCARVWVGGCAAHQQVPASSTRDWSHWTPTAGCSQGARTLCDCARSIRPPRCPPRPPCEARTTIVPSAWPSCRRIAPSSSPPLASKGIS